MSYGFIYLLSNKAMPCYYKVGCTERSPHARAAELSRASGVPEPFDVLVHIELDDFQQREQALHGHLGDFRGSAQREFFIFGPQHLPWLFAVFHTYPYRVGFSDCGWPGDLDAAYKHPDVWVDDPDAIDGLLLQGPKDPPIRFGELRLVA